MVADALIYHPTVAHYLRYVASTAGRDKLMRLVQYFARFYAWYLLRGTRRRRPLQYHYQQQQQQQQYYYPPAATSTTAPAGAAVGASSAVRPMAKPRPTVATSTTTGPAGISVPAGSAGRPALGVAGSAGPAAAVAVAARTFSPADAFDAVKAAEAAAAAAPYEAIKKQFGLSRKLLRVGKNVEHLKAAAAAADAPSMDPVLRYCAVGRQLAYALYLSLDAVTYLDAAGIRRFESAKRWQREAQRAWLVGLVFGTSSSVYNLFRLRQRQQTLNRKEGEGAVESKRIDRERRATHIQLVSDLCDIIIPAAALGYVELDDGVVGLAGTVSSLVGVWSIWKKTA